MPIYEYKCSKCGKIFEVIQKISDDPLTRCKFCKGKVDRLISNSSFQLKGSGWYLTDYARKSGGAAASDSESKSDDKAKPSEKSVETTSPPPAAKPDRKSKKE